MRSLWQTRVQPLYQRSILVRSGLWYLIGNSITKALSFGGIIVYTRLLTEAQFGTAAVFLTWTTIMYLVATLNLEATMARAYFDYEGAEREQYASAAYILGLPLVYMLVAAVFILPAAWVLDITGLERGLFVLVLVALPFRLGVHMVLRYQEVAQNYKASVWLSFWVEVAEFTACVLLMVIPPRLFPAYPPEYGRILGYVVVYTIVGSAGALWLLRRGRVFMRWPMWRYALALSLPLIPYALSHTVLAQADWLLIDHFVGRAATGIYSLAYQVGTTIFYLWMALQAAWSPWFMRQMKDESYDVVRVRTRQYTLVFMAITGLLILGAPIYMPIIGAYREAVYIVPPVMASGYFLFLQALYTNVEFYERKTGYMALGTIIAAAVNVLLNLIFIPRDGYLAAAWVTTASYAILFLIHAAVVRFRLKTPPVNDFLFLSLTGAAITALAFIVTRIA
jgi:O-antigen/teichoic acid export membrane protein